MGAIFIPIAVPLLKNAVAVKLEIGACMYELDNVPYVLLVVYIKASDA